MNVAGPMITSDVSVTPLDRLVPRAALVRYETITDACPPVFTSQRLGDVRVTSSGDPSGVFAETDVTRSPYDWRTYMPGDHTGIIMNTESRFPVGTTTSTSIVWCVGGLT